MKFQCWAPEHEQDPGIAAANFFVNDYAGEAAVEFAQGFYEDGDGDTVHLFPLRVDVRNAATGEVTEHIVEIDFDPTFTSRLTPECADRHYSPFDGLER